MNNSELHLTPEKPRRSEIFREQALEHIDNRGYGTVILARPISHGVITVLFFSFTIATVVFLGMFNTTRKAQCKGVLQPTAGVIRILPNQAGVIIEKRVGEGQVVRAGDVLFVLSSERSSGGNETTQLAISLLMKSKRENFNKELTQSEDQSRYRVSTVNQKIANLKAEISRIAGQIILQERRVFLAEESSQRYVKLHSTNYISPSQLEEKQAEVLDQKQRLEDLLRVKGTTQRELANAETEIKDFLAQTQREKNSLNRSIIELEQELAENEARREIIVRAPQGGIVTAITTQVGQTVGSGTLLASILPGGSILEAEIYVPSRAAGFIKPGMLVLLRYQAYPYQKFGQYSARVREIANTSLRPDELLPVGESSEFKSEPLYRIKLNLESQVVNAYGKSVPLKSGMLMDATVVLEHRRLYEWILDPLYSVVNKSKIL